MGRFVDKLPRFIQPLFRPSVRWSVAALLCVGALLGLIGVIGFETSMKMSSTEAFCGTSCHEMDDNVYTSLKETVHYSSRTGVKADCAACHLPKPFIPKMIRKVEALREVWGHMTGIIDTPEKYAAHQPAMKAREIARLRANDSAECRNCHKFDRMVLSLQSATARQYHQLVGEDRKTCIDCHQGIAHPMRQAQAPAEKPGGEPQDAAGGTEPASDQARRSDPQPVNG